MSSYGHTSHQILRSVWIFDRFAESDATLCVKKVEAEAQMEKIISASSCRCRTSAFLVLLRHFPLKVDLARIIPLASINSMQGLRCTRVTILHFLYQNSLPKPLHSQPFAFRLSSGLNGFRATISSKRPRSSKNKASGFNASKPPNSPHKAPRQPSAKEVNEAKAHTRRRFTIGPGKLIIISVVAFLGYKVYIWQTNPARSIILNPRFFTPFILKAREKVSTTSATLNLLSLPEGQNTENVSEAWRKGVWSVQVMQPELQIARSYTPLPPVEGAKPEHVRLFVRHEPQGEVSTFLHKINRGTIVHLRGPRLEYEIPEDIDEILFLAGGTGIAPALQVAHTLFNYRIKSAQEGPELRILWANRKREDSINGLNPPLDQQSEAGLEPIAQKYVEEMQKEHPRQPRDITGRIATPSRPSQTPLVEEVESLRARHGGKVIVDYFVDEEGSYITERLLRTYLSDVDQTKNQDGTPRTKVILVSGPDGFVDAFAGPKTWQGGVEIQGPLGGLLRKINPQGWEVWKL